MLIFQTHFCENFEIAPLQKNANLVEREKCCQTHIFLQNFVLIQPRTSPPKICKILLIFPILLTLTLGPSEEGDREGESSESSDDSGTDASGEGDGEDAMAPGEQKHHEGSKKHSKGHHLS